MLVYTCFHVFSPFSAHFYPPLHHNGKGSIHGTCTTLVPRAFLKTEESLVSFSHVNDFEGSKGVERTLSGIHLGKSPRGGGGGGGKSTSEDILGGGGVQWAVFNFEGLQFHKVCKGGFAPLPPT